MFSVTGKSLLLLITVFMSAPVSSSKPNIHDFSKLGRNSNFCQRQTILSRKQMLLVSLSRELSSNPQFSPNWEFEKSRWKAFLENKSQVYWPKGENKAAVFTHLQQNSKQNMYCSVSIFYGPGETPNTNTPPSFMCCHSQACLVTEMAQCLKPRHNLVLLENYVQSLHVSLEGDKLGDVPFLEDLYFKGLIFFMLLKLVSL